MAGEENVTKLVGLFMYHGSRPGGTDPVLYLQHVELMLAQTSEDVYRLQLVTKTQNQRAGVSCVACQWYVVHLNTL